MTDENYWAESAREHYDMERAERLGIKYSDLEIYDAITKRFDLVGKDIEELRFDIQMLRKIVSTAADDANVKLFKIHDNSNWIFWISIVLVVMMGYIAWVLS